MKSRWKSAGLKLPSRSSCGSLPETRLPRLFAETRKDGGRRARRKRGVSGIQIAAFASISIGDPYSNSLHSAVLAVRKETGGGDGTGRRFDREVSCSISVISLVAHLRAIRGEISGSRWGKSGGSEPCRGRPSGLFGPRSSGGKGNRPSRPEVRLISGGGTAKTAAKQKSS